MLKALFRLLNPDLAEPRRDVTWRQIRVGLLGLGRRFLAEETMRTASAMAFDLFLALIPTLALAGWILAQLTSPGTLPPTLTLLEAAPTEMHDLLTRHFERIGNAHLAPLGAVGGWWLASSAFSTLMGVYERSFGVQPRPWYRKRLIALGCALLAMFVVSLNGAVGVVVAIDQTGLASRGLNLVLESTASEAGGLVLASVVAVLFFAFLFKVSIQRRQTVRRRVLPGAVVTVAIGAVATWGFGVYLGHLARFTLFYGSLATVAITMAWLWLWCLAILFGIEVNVMLENEDWEELNVRSSRLGVDGVAVGSQGGTVAPTPVHPSEEAERLTSATSEKDSPDTGMTGESQAGEDGSQGLAR